MVTTTSELTNGVQLITHALPGAHTTALGLWLINGVRHQSPQTNGYAHLLEHLLFAGAGDLDGDALARCFARMGGRVNAQTGRELTALYGHVPEHDWQDLLARLIDMLLEPRFDDADLVNERSVVWQEMATMAGIPDEALLEDAITHTWRGHSLSWPILGNRDVLAAATAASVREYLHDLLQGSRIRVVAAGAVDHTRLEEACQPLSRLPAGAPPRSDPPIFQPDRKRDRRAIFGLDSPRGRRFVFGRERAHLLWLLSAPAPAHRDYPALALADCLLGGGTCSRLFRSVRNTLGLAYEVDSRLESCSDTGLWIIRAVCNPRQAHLCWQAVEEEITQLITTGPEPEELADARCQLQANLQLEQDNAPDLMERLARESIYLDRHPTPAEYHHLLSKADAAKIRKAAGKAWRKAYFWLRLV